MIVSNATPLIAFARIGELTLLERIVHHVTLPETVWSEVRAVTTYPGAEAIGQATWIAVRAVTSVPAELLALLDRGEAEVIALAEELRALEVLLDERAVRAIAITRGLPVIGTAGLLVRAKDRGFIPAVRPFLSRMQAAGVRYSQRFIETLLERFPVACATPLAMGSLTPCSLAVKHGASKWEPLQGNWENNMRGHHTCIQCDNAHAAA